MGQHERRHVGRARGHRPCRPWPDQLEADRVLMRGGVGPGGELGDGAGQRLLVSGPRGTCGFEDLGSQIVVEILPADLFDEVADQGIPVVRVRRGGPGLVDLFRRLLDEELAQRRHRLLIGGEQPPDHLLESGGVRQQVPQSDGGLEAGLQLEVQVIGDRLVEFELPALDELHGCCRDRHLGDRTDPEQGGVRIHRHRRDSLGPGAVRPEIGEAVAAFGEDLTVVHHRDRRPGDRLALQQCRQHAVQPCLNVLLLQLTGALRGCGAGAVRKQRQESHQDHHGQQGSGASHGPVCRANIGGFRHARSVGGRSRHGEGHWSARAQPFVDTFEPSSPGGARPPCA